MGGGLLPITDPDPADQLGGTRERTTERPFHVPSACLMLDKVLDVFHFQ